MRPIEVYALAITILLGISIIMGMRGVIGRRCSARTYYRAWSKTLRCEKFHKHEGPHRSGRCEWSADIKVDARPPLAIAPGVPAHLLKNTEPAEQPIDPNNTITARLKRIETAVNDTLTHITKAAPRLLDDEPGAPKSMSKRLSPDEVAEWAVKRWNNRHSIGTRVHLKSEPPTPRRTQSRAYVDPTGSALVRVSNIAVPVDIDDLIVIEKREEPEKLSQQEDAKRWNEKFPIGTPVRMESDPHTVRRTTTLAHVALSGRAVVHITDYPHAVMVRRLWVQREQPEPYRPSPFAARVLKAKREGTPPAYARFMNRTPNPSQGQAGTLFIPPGLVTAHAHNPATEDPRYFDGTTPPVVKPWYDQSIVRANHEAIKKILAEGPLRPEIDQCTSTLGKNQRCVKPAGHFDHRHRAAEGWEWTEV
jgi:hypothetical protein